MRVYEDKVRVSIFFCFRSVIVFLLLMVELGLMNRYCYRMSVCKDSEEKNLTSIHAVQIMVISVQMLGKA